MTRPATLASFVAFVGVLGVAGCGSPTRNASTTPTKPSTGPGATPKKPTDESLPIALTAGSSERRDEKGVLLYGIAWKTAAIVLGNTGGAGDSKSIGIREGAMNDVSGTVYEVEKVKSTFTARRGFAKKATQTLYLEGEVVVKSPEYQATLRAQKLEWVPNVKRYKATGNVTVTNPSGKLGPVPELLATADLRRVGTPDMFDQK